MTKHNSRKKCSSKTRAGKRCKRLATKGDRCSNHPPRKPGPKKGRGGRPRIVWDEEKWRMFDAMCSCGALEIDIAEAIGCDRDTVNTICKREKGMTFSAYRTLKKSKGRVSLAAKQLEVAMSGNVVMLIWLGKQWLEQREPPREFDLGNKDGEPLAIRVTYHGAGDEDG